VSKGTPQKDESATVALAPHRVKVWVVWRSFPQKICGLAALGGPNPVRSTVPAQAPAGLSRGVAGGSRFFAQPAGLP